MDKKSSDEIDDVLGNKEESDKDKAQRRFSWSLEDIEFENGINTTSNSIDEDE
jgi:hypothetical protein